MAVITSQQITRYYDLFRTIDLTFNKDVIRAVKLQPQQVFLKCLGDQWPCVIYSTSFVGAKVIGNISETLHEKIRSANNLVNLRFSFGLSDKTDPIQFFISAKITGFNPYSKENPNLNFVSLTYTQRPPDDLIWILGKLLETNINSKKRKEERIPIHPENIRRLGLKSKTAHILIQNIPRKCIIRDLSFSGAKVIIPGIAKFLISKPATLRVEMEDNPVFHLKGIVVRFEPVEGRKDIAALAIQFAEELVPIEYKMRINDFLSSKRVQNHIKIQS